MEVKFLSNFNWLLQIYQRIVGNRKLPFREIKMVSSRFSGKTHQVETLFALLFLQNSKKVVMNYVRARGEEIFKAMDVIEEKIKFLSNNKVKMKTNILKKYIKGSQNKINFGILNEIKEKVQKTGGKVGVSIEYEADYIITFYEEASQLEKELVENHRQSVRGNQTTKKLFIYASNPWLKTHWLMEEFSKKLPEDKKAMMELEEQGYNSYYDEATETLYFRPRYTKNIFMDPKDIAEVERLKEVNYNKWRIVSLGFSGTLTGSLYQASLQKLNEDIDPNLENSFLIGGIDWGDGKSAKASPTTAYFALVNLESGVHILDEYEYWNNKEETLTTEEQMDRLCDFFLKWYHKYQRPITVSLDNAALGDFFKMVQSVLKRKGYNESHIEFLPAFKPKNTWERVETVNVMLSLGMLRFKKENCPGLYQALDNCYEVIRTNPTEEMTRQRSHEWTHWIHAVEYMIGSWFKEFQSQFPIMIENKTIGNFVVK